MELELTVSKMDAGRQLKHVLRDNFRLSTGLLRRAKFGGSLLLNDAPVFADRRVCAGDHIRVLFPPETADYPPEEGRLSVLWEDGHYLAVDKPSGMITHPTHSRISGTLANLALHHILVSGGDGCHAVNRLDRDTGGIVLFAKSAYAKSLTFDAAFEKLYLAAAYGEPPEKCGTVSLPIARAGERDMKRVVSSSGAPSVTHYRVLAQSRGSSLLLLRLETGRTHQIRVHMSALGCPLLGDRLYGSAESCELSHKLGITEQRLHACRLSFRHPLGGDTVDISSCPPWLSSFGEALIPAAGEKSFDFFDKSY